MVDFAKLKKSSSVEKLTKALESQNKSYRDDRYWEPTVDKAGNGFATIRFLQAPAVDGDDAQEFVQIFTHGFKGPQGSWYIENSRTTLAGEKDPVSDLNTKLWNSGVEANKKKATDQKRKLSYISNILVVKDPANPENEGKVFLYKYGKKIFDKIKDKLGVGENAPDAIVDPDDVKFNPFNFWEGANFKLKIRKVDGFRNYDKSEFEAQSPVLGGVDSKIEELWRKSYSLKAEVAPNKFKSYEELEKKLNAVLGIGGAASSPRRTAEQTSVPEEEEVKATPTAEMNVGSPASADEDDAFAEFARLAKD